MHTSSEMLVELIDGELVGLDARWIVPHVRRCVGCAALLGRLCDARIALASLLRGADGAEPPAWAAATRTLATLGTGAGSSPLH